MAGTIPSQSLVDARGASHWPCSCTMRGVRAGKHLATLGYATDRNRKQKEKAGPDPQDGAPTPPGSLRPQPGDGTPRRFPPRRRNLDACPTHPSQRKAAQTEKWGTKLRFGHYLNTSGSDNR